MERDKWWQYQAWLPRTEHFTWKHPSSQDLILPSSSCFGTVSNSCTFSWQAPVDMLCKSDHLRAILWKSKHSPPLPQPDETVNRQGSHIDLLGVSNHWGNRLFSPPPPSGSVCWAGRWKCKPASGFSSLNRCGSDKDPGFPNGLYAAKPEENLISKSLFCTYSQKDAEKPDVCCCARIWKLFYTHKMVNTRVHTWSPLYSHTRPRTRIHLVVKWLCSRHAQFVSFHPGLMSCSSQGLSAPFEAPSRTASCNMRLFVVVFIIFFNLMFGKIMLSHELQ